MPNLHYKIIADRSHIVSKSNSQIRVALQILPSLMVGAVIGAILDLGYQDFIFLDNFIESWLAHMSLQHGFMQSTELSWFFNSDLVVDPDIAELGVSSIGGSLLGVVAHKAWRKLWPQESCPSEMMGPLEPKEPSSAWLADFDRQILKEYNPGKVTLKSTVAAVSEIINDLNFNIETLDISKPHNVIALWQRYWPLIVRTLNNFPELYTEEQGDLTPCRNRGALMKNEKFQLCLREFLDYRISLIETSNNIEETERVENLINDKEFWAIEAALRLYVLQYRNIDQNSIEYQNELDTAYQDFVTNVDVVARDLQTRSNETEVLAEN